MPQDAKGDAATFIRQIRGTNGEFASLIYLATAIKDRGKSSRLKGSAHEDQLQTVNLLKARIAELSRYSEKRMYKAAVKLEQIGTALKGQGQSPNVAQRLEPVQQLLRAEIDHARHKVQIGLQAVNDLDEVTGTTREKTSAKRAAKAPLPQKAAKVAPLKRPAKAKKSAATKRATKAAVRRPGKRTKKTSAEESSPTTAAGA